MLRKRSIIMVSLIGVLAVVDLWQMEQLSRLQAELRARLPLSRFHPASRSASVASAAPIGKPGRTTHDGMAAPSQDAATEHGAAAEPIVDDWLATMNDPEFMRLIAVQQRALVERRFGGLFKNLGLDSKRAAELANLLVQRHNASLDTAVAEVQTGRSPLEHWDEFQQEVQNATAQTDEQIQALIGRDGTAQMRQYIQEQNEEVTVARLQRSLAYGAAPLTPEQIQLMQSLLSQSQTSQITEDVSAVAQGFLSEAQMTALQNIKNEQLAAAQLRARRQQLIQPIASGVRDGP